MSVADEHIDYLRRKYPLIYWWRAEENAIGGGFIADNGEKLYSVTDVYMDDYNTVNDIAEGYYRDLERKRNE